MSPNRDVKLLPEAMRRQRLNDSLSQIDKLIERWNSWAMAERGDIPETDKAFEGRYYTLRTHS